LNQLKDGRATDSDQAGHRPFAKVLQDSAKEGAAEDEDPWTPTLRRLQGFVVGDAERIATGRVFDILGVPMRKRPQLTVRLSKLMVGLGWRSIRAHGLNDQGFLSRVRGYSRPVPGGKALM
jgi:hypothetical protein